MQFSFTLTEDLSLRQRIFSALSFLSAHEVRVGLPASAGWRNRSILAIQEHGSPVNRIPARPVIRPALQAEPTRSAMADAMEQGIRSAMNGDLPGAEHSLSAAGQAGADGIRAYIDSHIPPPNSPATVRRKGFDKPIYDTGELYRAFSYEVAERE